MFVLHNPCVPLIILCSVFCFQYPHPQWQTGFSGNAMNNTRIVLQVVSVHQYTETVISDIGGNVHTGM